MVSSAEYYDSLLEIYDLISALHFGKYNVLTNRSWSTS
jgi:hypothetical protein